MRNTVINTIHAAAKLDKNIIFLTADLGYSVIENFQKELPEQIINVGISEQNMIGIAAGLALSGKKVFVYSITPFVTLRCLEQIKVDVCYQNLDVTIIGVGGGFAYGNLGVTHHSIEDLGIMRSLPNMKIVSPADSLEAEALAKAVISARGPFYIRLNRGKEPNIHQTKDLKIKIGKGLVLKEGKDVALLAIGNIAGEAMAAAKILEEKGVSAEVVSLHTLKPLDEDLIAELAKKIKAIFTIEENNILGGLGSAVAEQIAENNFKIKFKRIGISDKYPEVVGSQEYLRDLAGLSGEKIAKVVKDIYEKN